MYGLVPFSGAPFGQPQPPPQPPAPLNVFDWSLPRGVQTPSVGVYAQTNQSRVLFIGKDKFFGSSGQPPPNNEQPNPIRRKILGSIINNYYSSDKVRLTLLPNNTVVTSSYVMPQEVSASQKQRTAKLLIESEFFVGKNSVKLVEFQIANHQDDGYSSSGFEFLGGGTVVSPLIIETGAVWNSRSLGLLETALSKKGHMSSQQERAMISSGNIIENTELVIPRHLYNIDINLGIEIRSKILIDEIRSEEIKNTYKAGISSYPIELALSQDRFEEIQNFSVGTPASDILIIEEKNSSWMSSSKLRTAYESFSVVTHLLYIDGISGLLLESLSPNMSLAIADSDLLSSNEHYSHFRINSLSTIELLGASFSDVESQSEEAFVENSDILNNVYNIGAVYSDAINNQYWIGNITPSIGKMVVEFEVSELIDSVYIIETTTKSSVHIIETIEQTSLTRESSQEQIEITSLPNNTAENNQFMVEFSCYGSGYAGTSMDYLGVFDVDTLIGSEKFVVTVESSKNNIEFVGSSISDRLIPLENEGISFEEIQSSNEYNYSTKNNNNQAIEISSSDVVANVLSIETDNTQYGQIASVQESSNIALLDLSLQREKISSTFLISYQPMEIGNDFVVGSQSAIEFDTQIYTNETYPVDKNILFITDITPEIEVSQIKKESVFLVTEFNSTDSGDIFDVFEYEANFTIDMLQQEEYSVVKMGDFFIAEELISTGESDVINQTDYIGILIGLSSLQEEFALREDSGTSVTNIDMIAYESVDSKLPLAVTGNTIMDGVSSVDYSGIFVVDTYSSTEEFTEIATNIAGSPEPIMSIYMDNLSYSNSDASPYSEDGIAVENSIIQQVIGPYSPTEILYNPSINALSVGQFEFQNTPSGYSTSFEETTYTSSGRYLSILERTSLGTSWIVASEAAIDFEFGGKLAVQSNTKMPFDTNSSSSVVEESISEVTLNNISSVPINIELWSNALGGEFFDSILNPIANLLIVNQDIRMLEVAPDSPGIAGNFSMSVGTFSSLAPNSSDRFGLTFVNWLATLPGDTVITQPTVTVLPVGVTITSVQYANGIVSWWAASSGIQGKFTFSVSLNTLGGRSTTKQAILLVIPD